MTKFRTLDNFEEDYFREHPEEIESYLREIFEDYAQNGDSGALLASLKIIAKIKGLTNTFENNLQTAILEETNPPFEKVNSIMKLLGYYLIPIPLSSSF
jgi:HTH-type transcriptional regulator / antitoxin HigA